MNEKLVTQAQWAKELGISPATFWRWRQDPALKIPPPLQLPGWPRWTRGTVDQVTRRLSRRKGLRCFSRALVSHSSQSDARSSSNPVTSRDHQEAR